MAMITIADEQMHKFLDLVRRCDTEDIGEIFDYAFSLLKITVETIEEGKDIVVYDKESQSIKFVHLPVANRIRERQGRLKPVLRIVE